MLPAQGASQYWKDLHSGSSYKRLEKGTFELPAVRSGQDRVVVDAAMLSSLLSGIELRAKRRRWYRRQKSA